MRPAVSSGGERPSGRVLLVLSCSCSRHASPLRSIAAIDRASLWATATRAIFLRPGSPRVTRSKNAFIAGLRRTACHAASHSSFRTVAGPSPVMWPRRSLPAELSWHGTSPR